MKFHYGINQPTNTNNSNKYIVYFRGGLLYIVSVPFLSDMRIKFVSLYLPNWSV